MSFEPRENSAGLSFDGFNVGTTTKKVLGVPDGWAAYARNGHLFVKKFSFSSTAPYPDLGCNAEIFTNHEMLEVESLGPLVNLKPRQSVEHVEEWSLFRNVPTPRNDGDVEAIKSTIL